MSGVKGLSEVLRRLKQLPKDIQEEVKVVVEETTFNITLEAKRDAPSAGDKLKTTWGQQDNRTNISSYIQNKISPDGFTGTVFIESGATELAIYIEFGTGASAAGYVPTLPQEFQEIARRYYINGKGTLIKNPFLLPAYFKNEKLFVKSLREALKKAIK